MFTYEPKRGGIFCHSYNIVPYPSPIMRREVILAFLQHELSPAVFKANATKDKPDYLEIGFGTGIFAYEFYRKGFRCHGYDISEDAMKTADAIFNMRKKRLHIKNKLASSDTNAYDILGAYEVLEHIEGDKEVLLFWKTLIKDNGFLLLSVPARMKRFGLRDIIAGHYRRYEKDNLKNLLHSCGFQVEKLVSYGFPLPALLTGLIAFLVDRKIMESSKGKSMEQKTLSSGVARAVEYRYKRMLPFGLLVFLSKVQRLFYNSDLGIGYVVLARKVASCEQADINV